MDYSILSTTSEMRRLDSEQWSSPSLYLPYWLNVLSAANHPFGKVVSVFCTEISAEMKELVASPKQSLEECVQTVVSDCRSFVEQFEQAVRHTSRCGFSLTDAVECVVYEKLHQPIRDVLYAHSQAALQDAVIQDRFLVFRRPHPRQFGIDKKLWLNVESEVFEPDHTTADSGEVDETKPLLENESEFNSAEELSAFEHSLESDCPVSQSESSYAPVLAHLSRLQDAYSPSRKLTVLADAMASVIDCVRQFHDLYNSNHPMIVLEADDMVMIFQFLLCLLQPKDFFVQLQFMADFSSESQLMGQQGYTLATLQTAAYALINTQRDYDDSNGSSSSATAHSSSSK
jgi:hypothetical protein